MLATTETLEFSEPSDPVAWPDNGARWVVDPRRDAPGLDGFMSHVHKLGAEQIAVRDLPARVVPALRPNYKVNPARPWTSATRA